MNKLLHWHEKTEEDFINAKTFYKNQYQKMIETLSEQKLPFVELEILDGKACFEVETEDLIEFFENLIARIKVAE